MLSKKVTHAQYSVYTSVREVEFTNKKEMCKYEKKNCSNGF